MIFHDRAEAGKQLAAALPELNPENTVVIALPRGGVPVAAEICAAHGIPMDLVFVRKIGAPGQPELAVGAVTDGNEPRVTPNDEVASHFGLSRNDLQQMAQTLLPEIERRKALYLQGRKRLPLAGKTLVVVDDGAATGTTLLASLAALRAQKPARIIVALPVAPRDLKARLGQLAETAICLSDLTHGAVGAAYRVFEQVDDETVTALMNRFAPTKSKAP
jgi:putative phosphoribosyl transferase